ncbi:hypothetical protein AcV7_004009 [Taiwanofungus camphoratus]|nr:hypothetical protein AcV7_004009 [Antrodia cinnamomea]
MFVSAVTAELCPWSMYSFWRANEYGSYASWWCSLRSVYYPDPGPRSGAGRGVPIFVFDPEFGGGRVRRYRTYTPSSPLRASGTQGPRALLTALRPASPQRDVFYPTNRSPGRLSPQEPVGQGSRGDPQRRGGGGNPFVLARRRRWERAARGQIAAGHGGGVPEHTRSAPWLLWARATTACARGLRVRGCEGVPESRGSGGPASVAIPRGCAVAQRQSSSQATHDAWPVAR